MTKKKRKPQAEQAPKDDTAEHPAELAEQASAESEAGTSASESRDVNPAQPTEPSDEVSVDDLLDDVRRSLIEAEAQGEEKKPGWLRRIKKGFQRDQPGAESSVEEEAIPLIPDVPVEQSKEDQYLDEIDELIEMLEPEASVEVDAPEP